MQTASCLAARIRLRITLPIELPVSKQIKLIIRTIAEADWNTMTTVAAAVTVTAFAVII